MFSHDDFLCCYSVKLTTANCCDIKISLFPLCFIVLQAGVLISGDLGSFCRPDLDPEVFSVPRNLSSTFWSTLEAVCKIDFSKLQDELGERFDAQLIEDVVRCDFIDIGFLYFI